MPSNTIVTATDFSAPARAAVERAALIARERKASLTLVYAYDEARWENLRALAIPRKSVLGKQAVGQAWEQIKIAADKLADAHGIAVSGVVALGRASDAIAETAKAVRASLVVLGPHGARLSDRLFIGSTALGVIRAADCPVLIVRKRSKAAFRRCLVGTDFSPASLRAGSAAAQLFPAAAITLLHAVRSIDGPMLFTGALREAIDSAKAQLRVQALERLAKAYPAGQPGKLDAARRKSVALPASLALLRELGKGGYDLLALGRDGRGALAERLLGSVPANMLVEAPVNLLVVP